MAQAITAPGDVVLVPNPSYPIHAFGFLMAGGVDPLGAGRADAGLFRRARARGPCIRSRSRSRSSSAIRRTRPRWSPRSTSTTTSSPSPRSTRSSSCPTSPMREVYFDGEPPPSVLQVPGAIDVAVEFTSMSKTFSMAGLAHGLRGRQRAAARGADAGEVLSRLRRLYADPGRGGRRAQRPGGLHPRDARDLQAPPRRDGRELRRRRLADPGAAPPRCSPGRRSRSSSATSAAWSSPSC